MSADNWGKCPNCQKNRDERKLTHAEALGRLYGKVSAEEYAELVKNPKHPKLNLRDTDFDDDDDEREYTLREDYEQHVNKEGKYYVSYSCSCSVCNFSFHYKHEQDVLTPYREKNPKTSRQKNPDRRRR